MRPMPDDCPVRDWACHARAALRNSLLVMLISVGGVCGIASSAQACPAETERARDAQHYESQLPDCRAYEQVSPVDKNTTDAMGKPGFVQSSPSGESVSYYSLAPFPAIPGASESPTYLSTRGGLGWSTQGLLPSTEPPADAQVLGLTDNGQEAVVVVSEEEGLLLAPGARPNENNLYARNNLTGEYRLIAAGPGGVTLVAATPDGSHILIQAKKEVLAGVADPQHAPYLYEWDRETGQLVFVGEAEGRVPEEGTVAGPIESEADEGEYPYDQNAISENGSRIFFSERGESQKVYLREPNVALPGTTEVSDGAAQWRAATPSGSFALYTEDGELYRFNVAHDTPSPGGAREKLAGAGARVLGVMGMSNDGSYVYFVAEGVLADNENGNHEKAEEQLNEVNLYEWHAGAADPVMFMGKLDKASDKSDWEGFTNGEPGSPDQGDKASRVSADGTKVLIGSSAKLTSYDNAGKSEAYLYDAIESLSATNPRCVSCNPGTAVASQETYLSENESPAPSSPLGAFMTRNLSARGTRVFFQTAEALVPEDTNGQMDVYEWEQEGTGSCEAGEGQEGGGCLYLLSTGKSPQPSYFGDASEEGEDVFLFTRQSLVSQDQDDNVDVYDVRVNGGLAGQSTPPASPCESEERCRGVPATAPIFGSPSSMTLVGGGNAPPTVPFSAVIKPTKKKPKSSMRARKLANALKACAKRPQRRRGSCRGRARRRYGVKKAKKSSGEGGR